MFKLKSRGLSSSESEINMARGSLMFDSLLGIQDRPPLEEPPTTLTLIRFSRQAMATTFEIALPFGTPHAQAAAEEALSVIASVEDQLTVYRADSEVTRLNAGAGISAVEVSESLFQFLVLCQNLWQQSEGHFDPATGALTKAWGFFKRDGQVPPAPVRNRALQNSGFGHVILDEKQRSVRFLRPNLELNFGSIGKGYALDRSSQLLTTRWGIRSALLQGGGSSVFALGHPPGQARGWPVNLQHPWKPEQSLGVFWLKNQGLGTSAATYQHFIHQGQMLGHVLDPRLGWPVSGTALASVLAPTAAEADARSTAVFVRGKPIQPQLSWPTLLLVDDSSAPVAYNLNDDVFDLAHPA